MIKGIIFTSNTGFTRRYAGLLSDRTGIPVYELCEAKKKIEAGSEIIYCGWLFANNVKGYKKAAGSYRVRAVCGVGLCPTGELLSEVRAASKIPSEIELFTLQGGLKREELRGINKFMINMLVRSLSSKKDATKKEKAMLDLILTGGDYVDENNLSAPLHWYNALSRDDKYDAIEDDFENLGNINARLGRVLQNYVDADRAELMLVAKKAYEKLYPTCMELDPENDGKYLITGILISAVGADKTLNNDEIDMMAELLEVSELKVKEYIKQFDERMVAIVDQFADTSDPALKSAVLSLVTSIAAIDGKITLKETAFIRKIIN